MKKHICLFLVILVFTVSFTMGQKDSLRVLFIGNSYTFFNDLPGLISSLAEKNGKHIYFDEFTEGGQDLLTASNQKNVREAIKMNRYDYVILQEQSTTPLFRKQESFFPAVRTFDSIVQPADAEVILFLTWAREYAQQIKIRQLPGRFYYEVFPDYSAAQDSLNKAYWTIANELDLALAPVGAIWKEFLQTNQQVNLWRKDHSHPAICGSLIGAFVFYSVLFQELPGKSEIINQCPKIEMEVLNQLIREYVLDRKEYWNIH